MGWLEEANVFGEAFCIHLQGCVLQASVYFSNETANENAFIIAVFPNMMHIK
jgi:hypothetical protein